MQTNTRDYANWRSLSEQSNHLQANGTNIQAEWGLQRGSRHYLSQTSLVSQFTPSLQALIEEVSVDLKASPTMIATLALGAIAVVVQGLYDVQRPNCDPTSTSLLCLAIQVSGGKKTTVTNALLKPHIEFQREINRDLVFDSDCEAEQRIWKTRVKACEALAKKHFDDADELVVLKQMLKEILREEPRKKKRATNIIVRNTTMEALMLGLHEGSPSAAIVEDEASKFFKDFIRHIVSINQGYDGSDIKVDRIATGTYFVEQPRLSLILAMQPRPFKKLVEENGPDWIEIGFFTRMLFGMCDQDNDTRLNQQVATRCERERYYACMASLLDVFGEKLKSGDMSRIVLTYSPDAQIQSEQTRQWLECASTNNGPLSNIREYVARCQEHIARIAANLHVIEGKTGTEISLDTVLHATQIVRWYAQEFQRLFGDLHMPQYERDAKSILNFLWSRYQFTQNRGFNIRWLAQYTWGGRELRSSMARVRAAIDFLESHQIVQKINFGNRCDIYLDHRFIDRQISMPSGLFRL